MATELSPAVAQTLAPHQYQFLMWLRQYNPKIYDYVLNQASARAAPSGLAGLGQTSFWDSITSAVSGLTKSIAAAVPSAVQAAGAIIPAIQNAQVQQKVLDVNLARAQAGQAPIDASKIVSTAPTATVAVGTTPGVQYAIYAGLGLLGLWLVTSLLKKK
jgi:hypothetical protein